MNKPYLKLELEIYCRDIMFFFGHDVKEMNKVLKKYGGGITEEMWSPPPTMGRFHINDKNQSIVWVPKLPLKCSEYGFLQHEVNHAVNHILGKLGMAWSEDSDEAYAYLTGYITEKVYEFIAKHHDKPKKRKK